MTHPRIRLTISKIGVPAVACALALAILTATTAGIASAATAGSEVWYGIVRHVSDDNIKVYDPKSKKELSFLIVPRFGNVFKADGRTSAQMSDIAAGQYVKVYYDQKALGAYHADRILIMSSGNGVEGVKHS